MYRLKMKSKLLLSLFIMMAGSANLSASIDGEHKTPNTGNDILNLQMWYQRPATCWNEALPLGNGRMAAMIYGDPYEERIQLNEATFWSGSPYTNYNEEGLSVLNKIRAMEFQGKFEAARDSIDRYMLSKHGHGMMFEPVGRLLISMQNTGAYTDYKRQLDLRTAVNTTSYTIDNVHYKRECFISYPDNVIAVRITADHPKMMNAVVSMETQQSGSQSRTDDHTMLLQVTSPALEGIEGKVKLNAYTYLDVKGGLALNVANAVKIKFADTITVYMAMRTNYQSYENLSADPARALPELRQAVSLGYDVLKGRHIRDFIAFSDRSVLQLPADSTFASLPTDERLAHYQTDRSLPALFYHFGRYLLISGSRKGGQPTTLQGLWNDDIRPEWDSKYTIYINTEMNYWPAEVTNLSEMHLPLMSMLKDLSKTGQITAMKMYGARGWTTHHNTDLWRSTGMVDGATWGAWPYGGIWLSQHIWYHYLYTGDVKFLREYYPVLKGASQFLCDFLVREPEHGWMVGAPSISPENTPKNIGGKKTVNYGCTIDNELAADIFDITVAAADKLGYHDSLTRQIKSLKSQLPPLQIGKYGQLQEWLWDWDTNKEHQSHVSHTYGLFPSGRISTYRTPLLAAAVKNTLLQRDEFTNTSWGNAWRVNLWARLHDGNKAFQFLQYLMRPATHDNGYVGSMDNMFSSIMSMYGRPYFQIDANYGLTSGIAQMLIQSHDGAIDILPALPDAWIDGYVKGLCARGGFIIDIEWHQGKVTKLVVTSTLGGECAIRTSDVLQAHFRITANKHSNTNPFYRVFSEPPFLVKDKSVISPIHQKKVNAYVFNTKKGGTYVFE
jgi:alpha-L-fucosidase 2